MSCGSVMNTSKGPLSISSYYDLQNLCPKNPLDLIANATLGGIAGTLYNSANYRDVTWTEINGVVRVDAKPVLSALGTDNLEKIADAAQWNFTHLTWDSASAVPIPLRRTMFLRSGEEWKNTLYFTCPSSIHGKPDK